jgi:hypothetical protein
MEIRFFGLFGAPSRKMNVLIIYTNKDAVMKKVDIKDRLFTHEEMTYMIDEKAIYYFKGKPMLFYRHGVTSPVIFGDAGGVDYTLSAAEVNSVLETKAVRDLLLAAGGGEEKLFWLVIANIALTAVIILIQMGVIKVGGKP